MDCGNGKWSIRGYFAIEPLRNLRSVKEGLRNDDEERHLNVKEGPFHHIPRGLQFRRRPEQMQIMFIHNQSIRVTN